MKDIQLGTTPSPDAKRDAIHIAVYPAIAGEGLSPGNHVGIKNGIASMDFTPFVGIADPYQWNGIREGERVWVLLYPNTVAGLRHEWTHPTLTDAQPTPAPYVDPYSRFTEWGVDNEGHCAC